MRTMQDWAHRPLQQAALGSPPGVGASQPGSVGGPGSPVSAAAPQQQPWDAQHSGHGPQESSGSVASSPSSSPALPHWSTMDQSGHQPPASQSSWLAGNRTSLQPQTVAEEQARHLQAGDDATACSEPLQIHEGDDIAGELLVQQYAASVSVLNMKSCVLNALRQCAGMTHCVLCMQVQMTATVHRWQPMQQLIHLRSHCRRPSTAPQRPWRTASLPGWRHRRHLRRLQLVICCSLRPHLPSAAGAHPVYGDTILQSV